MRGSTLNSTVYLLEDGLAEIGDRTEHVFGLVRLLVELTGLRAIARRICFTACDRLS